MAAGVVHDVQRLRCGRCARTREAALRRTAAEVDRANEILRPADLSDGIYHRLAEGSDGQRAAEEAPVRDGGAAVPTRVSDRGGPGFLPTHDRTRARVRLVRRGRRVRGCPSNPLETHVPVE